MGVSKENERVKGVEQNRTKGQSKETSTQQVMKTTAEAANTSHTASIQDPMLH